MGGHGVLPRCSFLPLARVAQYTTTLRVPSRIRTDVTRVATVRLRLSATGTGGPQCCPEEQRQRTPTPQTVHLQGLEPRTSCVSGRRSNQVS